MVSPHDVNCCKIPLFNRLYFRTQYWVIGRYYTICTHAGLLSSVSIWSYVNQQEPR